MERALGGLFLALTLAVLTFVFYLHVNSLGLLYWRTHSGNELICHYYSGLGLTDVSFHNSQRRCPLWRQMF